MATESLPYVVPLLLAGCIAIGLAFYTWQHRATPGALSVAVLLVGAANWAILYAFSVASPALGAKVFFETLLLAGRVSVPLGWLVFVLQFTRHNRSLSTLHWIALSAVPAATILVGWTNPWHGLLWESVALDTSGPVLLLEARSGPWLWLYTAYAYLVTLGGIVLLARAFVRHQGVYRGQVAWLSIAAVAPLAANLVQISGLSPLGNLSLAPFAFVLTGLALVQGVYRYRLFDVVPVAHRAIIAGMSDAVIVLDARSRVVDLNPAAEALTGWTHQQATGRMAQDILAAGGGRRRPGNPLRQRRRSARRDYPRLG